MKIGVLAIFFLSLHFKSLSQVFVPIEVDSSEVKLSVREEFRRRFEGTSAIKWHTVAALSYEVHFQMGGKYYEALYRRDGKVLQLKTLIQKDDVSKDAMKEVIEDHPGFNVEKVFIEIHEGIPCYYIFYLENDDERAVVKLKISDYESH